MPLRILAVAVLSGCVRRFMECKTLDFKKCLYSKYYADFATFKTVIEDCLSQTHSTHKPVLDTLLTLKCQTFEKAQFVTV
jgi:hypothetical protein